MFHHSGPLLVAQQPLCKYSSWQYCRLRGSQVQSTENISTKITIYAFRACSISGVAESPLWRAPSASLPQTLLTHGRGWWMVKTSHSYQGTIPVNQSCLTYMLLFLSCEIVKITKSYPGRSANVRTPLWPVHGFSLRDVQLHQISGPRSPGDSQ